MAEPRPYFPHGRLVRSGTPGTNDPVVYEVGWRGTTYTVVKQWYAGGTSTFTWVIEAEGLTEHVERTTKRAALAWIADREPKTP